MILTSAKWYPWNIFLSKYPCFYLQYLLMHWVNMITGHVKCMEQWTVRTLDLQGLWWVELSTHTAPGSYTSRGQQTQQHTTSALPHRLASCSQAMNSTWCDLSPHPLVSVTQMAKLHLAQLSKNCFPARGFSQPTLSTCKLILIYLFHIWPCSIIYNWTVQPKWLSGLSTRTGPKTSQRGTQVHIDWDEHSPLVGSSLSL